MGISAVLACASLLASQTATATTQGIPYRVNFQGRLTDNNGNILADGSYNIKFRIFDAATSGTNLWEGDRVYGASDHRITVANGLFSIQLGDTGQGDPALSPSIFNTSSLRYLEIELPSTATNTCASNGCASFTEGPFTPRHILGASPYAFVADTLDGLDSTDFGQITAANAFTGTNTFSKAGGAGIVLSGTPAASGSILQVGSALSSGNVSGTLIGANGTFTGDLLNLQVSNTTKLKVDNSGNLTLASGAVITIGAAAGSSTTCSGGQFLQNQTTAGGVVTGGTCATPAGSGASTTLGNLGTTSINADLLPSTNNARAIGSVSAIWANVFTALVDAGTTTTTLGLGTINATAITIGKSGTTTTFNGPLTLASGQGLTLNSGTVSVTSANTTGNSASFANSSLAPAAAAIASLLAGTFTAGSANTTGNSTTNGLLISPTVATSGAGTKSVNGVEVGAPTITGCATGTCTLDGLKVSTLTAGSASTITSQGVDIQASGISAGTLTGLNISAITPAGGTETALAVGSGWDNVLSVNGTPILNGSGVLQSAGLSGSYTNVTGTGTLAAGTWQATQIAAAYGGTGQTTYTIGDLLYASGSTALSKLADVATGSCLTSGGVGTAPAWGACGAAGANTALSNLASVAINTSLVSDTDNTDDLGSSGIGWRTGYFSTSVITPLIGPAASTALTIQTTTTGAINLKPAGTSNVVIGTSDTTGTLLVLDTKTSAGDPTGVNGGMYYNSNNNKFRCYEGSVWKSCTPLSNASTADQAVGASTTAYLAGSLLNIPSGGLQVGSTFLWRITVTKTAAGTVANTFDVRIGTNGTTSDTSRCSFTMGTQTGVADTAVIEIAATVRSVSSTSTWACNYRMTHNLSLTGFDNALITKTSNVTSGTFDDTTSGLKVGVSQTTGASYSLTFQQVQATTTGF